MLQWKVFKNDWFRGLNINFAGLFVIWPLPTNSTSYLTAPSILLSNKTDLQSGPLPSCLHACYSLIPCNTTAKLVCIASANSSFLWNIFWWLQADLFVSPLFFYCALFKPLIKAITFYTLMVGLCLSSKLSLAPAQGLAHRKKLILICRVDKWAQTLLKSLRPWVWIECWPQTSIFTGCLWYFSCLIYNPWVSHCIPDCSSLSF